ncbi:uncharacterized protein LOC125956890 [Anopheles darlingi]|uniref:uncharacterized protein LOC125956890 n=1 Tax=Anopheles darlingi TaxID=43151 RepID=UPI00210060FB|nr:uncharacterized protein LOC125956890 [Anopheles darlingi]
MQAKRYYFFVVFAVLLDCSIASTDPDCQNLTRRHREILECCEAGAIIPLKDIADCPAAVGVDDPFEKMTCYTKCNFEALGLLNGEEINEEKLFEYVDRLDDPWKEEAIDAVSDCLEKLAVLSEKMSKSKSSATMHCHHAARAISACLIRKTIDWCPYVEWRDSSFCYKVRNGHCFKFRDRSANDHGLVLHKGPTK